MSNKVIANAISAVLALGLSSTSSAALTDTKQNQAQNPMTKEMQEMMHGELKGMERCYGVAKAGQNDCGTASHGCGGEAKIDGDKAEWVAVPTGLCTKIAGGSLKGPTEA